MGLPDYAEVAEAVLDFKLKAAGGDVRSFLNAALEGRSDASGSLEGMEEALFAAVDAVEAESGPLAAGNAAAFQALAKHIEVSCCWASGLLRVACYSPNRCPLHCMLAQLSPVLTLQMCLSKHAAALTLE